MHYIHDGLFSVVSMYILTSKVNAFALACSYFVSAISYEDE
jgi:hypothetical protein